jgi:uncharacterized protein involved in exopolysaccharide biosynthesis
MMDMNRKSHRLEESTRQQSVLLVSADEESIFRDDLKSNRQRRERSIALLQLLWQRRIYLLKLFGCGFLASLLIAFLIPSKFESTARLMPPDQTSGSGGLAMLAGLAGKGSDAVSGLSGMMGDVLGLKTSGDLFVGVLQSRTVQDDLISKFSLRKVYRVRDWDDARKILTTRTDVNVEKKSGIITIQVTDKKPERASEMGEEYIKELNWVMTQLNTSAAHRERVFLEDRLQQVKVDLETAERDFSQFASKNAALDVPAQGKAMVEATADLEGQLIAARTEEQGLKQIYTDGNIRVRSIQARIDELQKQLVKLGGGNTNGDVTAPGNDVAASLYPSIRQLPLLGVTYADLLRRSKIQEAIYETLTQQYELAKLQEAKELPSVKVLDPPNVPEKKIFPPRGLFAVLGGTIALVIGVGWMLLYSRWHRIDPQDPARIFARQVVNDVRTSFIRGSRNGSPSNEVPALSQSNENKTRDE